MSTDSSNPPADETPHDEPLLVGVEQLPLTLFDEAVLAVRAEDGLIYLAVTDLCTVVDLAVSSQVRRIRAHEDLSAGLARFAIDTGFGIKEQLFLQIDVCPIWLVTISTRRAKPSVRGRLQHLRRYLIAETYAAFARATGLPQQSSRQIEDLRDLDHVDTALTTLSERQERLEISQDKARLAWRDLDARVRALEAHRSDTISVAQRGYIYNLVHAWATARVAHTDTLTYGAAVASCWAALKARFQVAKYTDLPIKEYSQCVAFIRASYRSVTGEELVLPEQSELSLE